MMACEHLRELFDLCEKHDLQIASPDAIKVVCRQCEEQEVCPSALTDGAQVLQLKKSETVVKTTPNTEAAENSPES